MYILNTSMILNKDGECEIFYNNIPEVDILNKLNRSLGKNDNEHLKNEREILKYFKDQGYTLIKEAGFNNPVVKIDDRILAINTFAK